MTNEEYYSALPPNGLELAEEQAKEYLEQAQQDEAYPKEDVAAGLITIQTLQILRELDF